MLKSPMLLIQFTEIEGGTWHDAQVKPLDLVKGLDTGMFCVFRHINYEHFWWSIIKPAAVILPCGKIIYDFILKQHGENPVRFVKNT